ncbi:hypothetical protein [Rhizobium alvei]|uniref:Uncharacterized protein n=1 Tax=Rhizobium alvei TaxID=1132659 RepID=A0ABT8YGR2_9HYPH|nr:hypothetical protein [Rhizobium alvei]MDO6962852.1 hypothetical protein [Rhizobium alvei]
MTYWVNFENPTPLCRMGWGVTAIDEADARVIVMGSPEWAREPCAIASIRAISFDEIEKNHVRPNMGNILARGIWFPDGI